LTYVNSQVDVEFFDPPMCCPTGLCGPIIDQELLDVSEMVQQLQSNGLHVERYQMTTHPGKFTGNPEVMRLIREKQMAALPITLVRGKIVANGSYPKIEDIQESLIRSKYQ
ncbi:MAG: arsenite efflux transporter metallochaperone ArsD, partial [Brevefilum sp.]|nr:arsenite efflux transporter metallochaperone ArsD [Brevefilum sp.]